MSIPTAKLRARSSSWPKWIYASVLKRIRYAGSETDIFCWLQAKYSTLQQIIKDNYAIFEVLYNGTDNNDYVDGQGLLLALSAALGNLQTSLHFARWLDNSAATTVLPKLHRPVPWHWKTISRIRTHTRRCSSTTTQTIWVVVVTSPTLKARWCSISSMYHSARYLWKNETTL